MRQSGDRPGPLGVVRRKEEKKGSRGKDDSHYQLSQHRDDNNNNNYYYYCRGPRQEGETTDSYVGIVVLSSFLLIVWIFLVSINPKVRGFDMDWTGY